MEKLCKSGKRCLSCIIATGRELVPRLNRKTLFAEQLKHFTAYDSQWAEADGKQKKIKSSKFLLTIKSGETQSLESRATRKWSSLWRGLTHRERMIFTSIMTFNSTRSETRLVITLTQMCSILISSILVWVCCNLTKVRMNLDIHEFVTFSLQFLWYPNLIQQQTNDTGIPVEFKLFVGTNWSRN